MPERRERKANNWLVTGSRGYIGEELVNFLTMMGCGVRVIDKHCGYGRRVEEVDLDDYLDADVVVHLAALSGIKACEDNQEEAVKSNVIATNRLMEWCQRNGKKMFFASSAAANNPKSSVYAFTKYLGEQYAYNLNLNHDADIFVLRFSNVFGGEKYLEKKNSVVASLIKQRAACLENLDPVVFTITGDGTQTRDFVHVDDVVNVIWELRNTPVKPTHVDVCTGVNIPINNLARAIYPNARINYVEGGAGVHSSPGNTSFLSNMGILPDYRKLEEYLEEMSVG